MFRKINNDKSIQELQQIIDEGGSASVIINKIEHMVDTHKNPLESINTLFSLTESLLKKILSNNESCGKNIHIYHDINKNTTIIDKKKIKDAIYIRNKTAHALLVRNIAKTDFAVNTYIKYIRIIAYENKIDLDKFIPKEKIDIKIEEKPRYRTKKTIFVISFICILLLCFYYFNGTSNLNFLTGSTTGTYYSTAQNIKEIIAPDITVLESKGSIDNMKRIGLSNEDEPIVAFVQNDILQDLSEKARSHKIEEKKILNKTKVLMPLYKEEIHILVREDDLNIKNFRDLKGKRISIGMENSGTARTAELLYFKLFHEKINEVYYPFNEALKELKDKSIDAIILIGGQPLSKKLNKNMYEVRLIPYEGEPLEGYSIGYITKESYPWLKQEKIKTLSIESFIVTNIICNKESLVNLKEFIQKLKEYKMNPIKKKHLKITHPKLEDFFKNRCLPTLPKGLEYHTLVKWSTTWCKKE